MAQSVQLGYAWLQDGATLNGQLVRTLGVAAGYFNGGTASAMTVQGGVINSVGGLQVVQNSGMNITVNAGFGVVPNSTSATQGGYVAGSMTSTTLTVPTSNPSNPRIDLVCLTVVDTGDDTGYSELQVVEGTAAASPSAPATPSNSIVLAQIAVAAGATSITTSNITDARTYTNSAGGVIPWPNTSLATGGHPGLIAYDIANDRFFHATTTPKQLKTLPWAPQYVTHAPGDFGLAANTQTTICSTNITTDGATDIKVTYHIPGLYQPTTTGPRQVIFTIWCDGNQLSEIDLQTNTDDLANISHSGFTDVYTTSSLSGDTPSAGTHTIYMKGAGGNTVGSGDVPWVKNTATRNVYLRVEPVNL
jgi:hypothetical protein